MGIHWPIQANNSSRTPQYRHQIVGVVQIQYRAYDLDYLAGQKLADGRDSGMPRRDLWPWLAAPIKLDNRT